MKILEWTEKEARLPVEGSIGLQGHGGGSPEGYDGKDVGYRNVRMKKLGLIPASADLITKRPTARSAMIRTPAGWRSATRARQKTCDPFSLATASAAIRLNSIFDPVTILEFVSFSE